MRILLRSTSDPGARGWLILLGISLVVHVGLYTFLGSVNISLPDDLEWSGDQNIEFGVAEEMQSQAPSPSLPAPVAPPPPSAAAAAEAVAHAESLVPDASVPDASVPDASVPDASVPDASVPDASLSDRRASVDAGRFNAPTDASIPRDGAGDTSVSDASHDAPDDGMLARDGGQDGSPASLAAPVAERIPAGAHIALRLSMRDLRESRYGPSVRRLLESNPDWDAILGGSGVSPVDDVDQLLLAAPSFQRSQWVIAGRHHLPREEVNQAVSRLAEAQQVDAGWRTEAGIERARWANPGPTEREISLLSDRHFAICRASDMPALLALAELRRASNPESRVSGADALIGLESGVLASAEVEGARRLIRVRPRPGMSAEVVPVRVQLFIRDAGTQGVEVRGTLWFESSEQATSARAFWEAQRLAYAGNILVSAIGLSGPLMSLRLEAHEEQLRFHTTVAPATLQILIRQASLAMARRRRPRPQSTTGAPPAGDTPAQNTSRERGSSPAPTVPAP